jgi:hypothetical protein
MRSYGYFETAPASYIPTIIDCGADALVAAGHVNADTAAALKAEACSRVAAGRFLGHIAYASLVAALPAAEPADRGEPDPTNPNVKQRERPARPGRSTTPLK